MGAYTYDYGNQPEAHNGHNGRGAGAGGHDVLEFPPNVPVPLTLKFAKPKAIQTKRGLRYMITTTHNTVAFVDGDVALKIEQLRVRPGEIFWVRYRETEDRLGGWDVWLDPRVEQKRATVEGPTNLETKLRESLDQVSGKNAGGMGPPADANSHTSAVEPNDNKPHVVVTDGRPRTRLEEALKTVVGAVKAATDYAQEIGYQMPPFSSEDIRTMANTLIIDGRNNA